MEYLMSRAVVYYSFEGNTREAAQKIASLTGADLIEIKPVKEISEFGPRKMMEGGGKAIFGFGSAILPLDKDLSSYDEIMIGTPIWAGRCAPYIKTLLKDESIRSKVTGVFTLSGSGNNRQCIKYFRKKLPNLKYDVSLHDRVGKKAGANDEAIGTFVSGYIVPGEKELKN